MQNSSSRATRVRWCSRGVSVALTPTPEGCNWKAVRCFEAPSRLRVVIDPFRAGRERACIAARALAVALESPTRWVVHPHHGDPSRAHRGDRLVLWVYQRTFQTTGNDVVYAKILSLLYTSISVFFLFCHTKITFGTRPAAR